VVGCVSDFHIVLIYRGRGLEFATISMKSNSCSAKPSSSMLGKFWLDWLLSSDVDDVASEGQVKK
jgi:hypothetical protein